MATLFDHLVSENSTFWWHGGARNHRPDANHDNYIVNENTGPIGENIGTDLDVLENDTDPDGDNLDIIWVSDPRHGTASIKQVEGQDVINYVPDLNNETADWFFYVVSDDRGGYDLTTVNVEINAARPAFQAADWYVG
jgi:hypothetical protein